MKKQITQQICAILSKYWETLPLSALEAVLALLRGSVSDSGTIEK